MQTNLLTYFACLLPTLMQNEHIHTHLHSKFTIENFHSTSPWAISNSHVKCTLYTLHTDTHLCTTGTRGFLMLLITSCFSQSHDLVIFTPSLWLSQCYTLMQNFYEIWLRKCELMRKVLSCNDLLYSSHWSSK